MWWKMKDLFQDLPFPEPSLTKAFDGKTYNPGRDYVRLNGQLKKVFELMKDGNWRQLDWIHRAVGGSEASISARLRDLRKPKYGAHTVERRHIRNGLFEYRLTRRV